MSRSLRPLPGSEAVLPDLLGNYLLDALDVVNLLALQVAPDVLQLGLGLGVGDVLIVAPESVQPLAQVVDQVVVVVLATEALSDVLEFLFCRQCHDEPPSLVIGSDLPHNGQPFPRKKTV